MSKGKPAGDLLIAGGARDPNLLTLIAAARQHGGSPCAILHDAAREPALAWRFEDGALLIDGRPVDCVAAFVRYDVFSTPLTADPMTLDRSQAWYAAVAGWCLSQPHIRQLNRVMDSRCGNKAYVLAAARRHGLDIPTTTITNEKRMLDTSGVISDIVVKPVAGGAFTLPAEQASAQTEWREGRAPLPAFIQEKLSYPEYRVFIVGRRVFILEIRSESLDYRANQMHSITLCAPDALPVGTVNALQALAAELALDFCAFDMKTRPNGGVCFLEVNSGPMFAAFDRVADGAISKAMVDELLGDA